MKNLFPSTLIVLITGCAAVQPMTSMDMRNHVLKHFHDVGIDVPQIKSIQCTQPNTHGYLACSVNHMLAEQSLTDLLMCNQHSCREIPINDKGRLVLPVEECDHARNPFNE